MQGFPKELGAMWGGPAVHDIDNDGIFDIICATYNKKIYAIDVNSSEVKSGFPFTAQGRFVTPPTIADVNSDGNFEIIVGSSIGEIYVLKNDGTILAEYDSGNDIRGGISVSDVNNDGDLELLFGGDDDKLHVWNPQFNELIAGWPRDLGGDMYSEPLVVDIDGDNQMEIIATRRTGMLFAFEYDGTIVPNFPINIDGSIESTPTIEDLDNDGNLEIIVSSTSGIDAIDIKYSSNLGSNWSIFRGSSNRAGVYESSLMYSFLEEIIIPDKFYVSQNYPNPFNPSTNFYINMPEAGNLSVNVFDVNGRMIKELINTNVNSGRVQVRWSGKNQFDMMSPTGIYFLRVETSTNYHVQKLALVK